MVMFVLHVPVEMMPQLHDGVISTLFCIILYAIETSGLIQQYPCETALLIQQYNPFEKNLIYPPSY